MSLPLPMSSAAPLDLPGLLSSCRPGWTLPQPFYTSQEVFAHDYERVLMRQWLFAGTVAEVKKPGQYFLYNIGRESVIVLRGDDGQVRAFYNVCRHRGSVLCTQETGQVKKLVCPYHQWVFDKDGTLLSAKFMQADFDRSENNLIPVHCEVIEGLIFICLGDTPPDVLPLRAAYGPHIAPYRLDKTQVAHQARYEVKANWKLIAENFRECYHCTIGHPEYCKVIIGSSQLEPPEKYRVAYDKSQKEWELLGLNTENVSFEQAEWYYCYRYPYHEGYQTMSLDGLPVAPKLGDLPDGNVGVWSIVQYPNFWMDANRDNVFFMRVTPVHALLTQIDLTWVVHEDAMPGVDFDPARVTEFWRITGEQDWKLCEENQAGVNSRAYRPNRYGPAEGGAGQFDSWYLRMMREAE